MAKKKTTEISSEILSSPEMSKRYLEIADVIILILDNRGDIVLINRKGEKVLGWKKKELIGKNWFETCVLESERKHVKKYFDSMIKGETKVLEKRDNFIITKDGKVRLISWNNRTLKDSKGNIICTLSSGEDVTDIKEAEEKLRNSEEKYRILFETMVQGVVYLY